MLMSVIRVFLTGEPGCGKTTVIREIVKILNAKGIRSGGMISGEIRTAGVRVGFSLEDLMTQQRGILAHIDQKEGPSVGKYRVNLADVERVGVAAIRRAIDSADVIVVDELGPMELHSASFIAAIETALKCPKPILGTIHKRAAHNLVTTIRSSQTNEIIEVKAENRETLPRVIVEKLAH